jgi:hypothetical protein
MIDTMRNVDASTVAGRRQGIVAVDCPGRAKNDDAQSPAQADDAFILGRIEDGAAGTTWEPGSMALSRL